MPEADTNILVEGEAERDHRIGIRVFLMGYWLTYELSQRKRIPVVLHAGQLPDNACIN